MMKNSLKLLVCVVLMLGCYTPVWCSQAKAPMSVVTAADTDTKSSTRSDLKEPVAALWQSFVKEARATIRTFDEQYKKAAAKASESCGEHPVFLYQETKDAEVSVENGTGPFVKVNREETIFTIDMVAASSIDDYTGIKRISLFRGVLGDQFTEVRNSVFTLANYLKLCSDRVGAVGDGELNTDFLTLCKDIENMFNITEQLMIKHLEKQGFYVLSAESKQAAIDIWKQRLALLDTSKGAVDWLEHNGNALVIWFFFGTSKDRVLQAFTDECARLTTMFKATFLV